MDLSNQNNWLLITDQIKVVTDVSAHPDYDRRYLPLESTELQVTSPIIMISLNSFDIRSRWRTGAWATLFAQVNGRLARIGERKFCELYQDNYLSFSYLGQDAIPFLLRIDYPWWIKDISLKVWQYIDQSGRYLSAEIEQSLIELEDRVNGETLRLTLIQIQPIQEGDTTLYQSIFESSTPYDAYEVGRFKKGSQALSDPLIQANPKNLRAIFTSKEPMDDGSISVTVKPI
jgi:hypothetical protein